MSFFDSLPSSTIDNGIWYTHFVTETLLEEEEQTGELSKWLHDQELRGQTSFRKRDRRLAYFSYPFFYKVNIVKDFIIIFEWQLVFQHYQNGRLSCCLLEAFHWKLSGTID